MYKSRYHARVSDKTKEIRQERKQQNQFLDVSVC